MLRKHFFDISAIWRHVFQYGSTHKFYFSRFFNYTNSWLRAISIGGVILFSSYTHAEEPITAVIQLDKDISITFMSEPFKKSGNKITDCGGGYICLINDKPAWGADGKLPDMVLKKLYVNIKGNKAELEISGMFNPMLKANDKHNFKITKYYADMWRVRGVFSDGAGAYHAEWLVANGQSMRIMIGDSELLYDSFEYLFKQSETDDNQRPDHTKPD